MRYFALATDYDGTIAHHGRVPAEVVAALKRVVASGRKLILVTGREIEDLIGVFPELALFDAVVAENGALLYDPRARTETMLADPPPPELVRALRARGVENVSIGRSIVATWTPHETAVLEVIHELGLEWHIIFNKGAVMALPSGVNKATGLAAALAHFRLSPHNVVGVGDAENDQAFLRMCECAVAVANALPAVREGADLVTAADHGAGVVELVERLVEEDLASLEARLARRHVLVGWNAEAGDEYRVPPWGLGLLITGASGSGKSTVATGVVERLAEAGYQYCIVDPEGDYTQFLDAIVLGDKDHTPSADEILDVLKDPARDVVANVLGIPLHDRPAYFAALLARLQELRVRTGRPHWILVDEAHHLMPRSWEPASLGVPQDLEGVVYVTVHPDLLSPAVLGSVDVVMAVGQFPEKSLAEFSVCTGRPIDTADSAELAPGHALVWDDRRGAVTRRVKVKLGKQVRKRHTRKYAEGDLGPERSFYFRGPDGKLKIQAQNLALFSQIGDGVDDETWRFHLDKHDYSRWIREQIKDGALADEVEAIETATLPPAESRRRIRAAITAGYTLPDSKPSGWRSEDPTQ